MIPLALRRRAAIATGDPTPPAGASLPGAFFTANSAIESYPYAVLSQVYVRSSTFAGSVDATKTAVVTKDAGGAGVHAFNASGAVDVFRSNYFVAQPGSTACVGTLHVKNHAGDSGQKITIAFLTTSRGIESSTNASPVVLQVKRHGLSTGHSVTVSGHRNVDLSASTANGTWTVTKVDDDHVSLNGSAANGVGSTSGVCDSSNVLATTVLTLTGTDTLGSVTASGTTPNAEYEFRITNETALGADSGARAYLGAQAVTCTGATGIFAGAYGLLELTGPRWFYNLDHYTYPSGSYWTYTTERGETTSTFSVVPMWTDASTLVVECGSLGYSQGNQLYSGFDLQVNGTWENHQNTAGIANELITVSLSGAMQSVNLSNPGRNFVGSAWSGTYHRRIFFPISAFFSVTTTDPTDPATAIVVSPADSICDGFNGFPQGQRAWVPLLRAATGRRIYDDAAGGDRIYTWGGHPHDQGKAAKIAQVSPADAIWAIGTNDYEAEDAGGQSFATVMGYASGIIDEIHTANPSTKLRVLLPWNKTLHDRFYAHVNGQGHLLDYWRDGLTKQARDRGNPTWLLVFDTYTWTDFNTTTNYLNDDYGGQNGTPNDPTHPNSAGQAKMAVKVQAALAATHLSISPFAPTVAAGGSQTFTAVGGNGTKVWSFVSNVTGGTLNSSSGAYTKGGAGTDVIKVTDDNQQVSTTEIP